MGRYFSKRRLTLPYTHRMVRGLIAPTLATCGLMVASIAAAQTRREVLPQPMFTDPSPEQQIEIRDDDPLVIPLWVRALGDDLVERKIQTADSIAIAHGFGMPGLEVTIQPLIEAYQSDDARVKLAAARTLNLIDARAAQEPFEADLPTLATDLAPWVEPALLRWKSEVALQLWRSRAADPNARLLVRQSAFHYLGAWGDAQSLEDARNVVLDEALTLALRGAAAKSIAERTVSGEEDLARALLDSSSSTGPLLATMVLMGHTGEATQQLLTEIIRSEDDAAAGMAAKRLFDLDPRAVYPLVLEIRERRERDLRQVAVATFLHRNEPADVDQLLEMLDDFHPDVRHDARLACEELTADARYAEKIPQYIATALAERRGPEHWRSLEQCCVYVGRLDHEANASSLIELLDEERIEVNCAAAWALRMLAVEETFEPLHQYWRRCSTHARIVS
ncbi:MAG: hypothetical protein R3B96_17370 [Pirellulaceae bacterium]